MRTAALVALLAACSTQGAKDKEEAQKGEAKPQAGSEGAKPSEPTQPTQPSQPSQPPSQAAGEVRPPTADDLAKYTEGLAGSGTLMARIETTMGDLNCVLYEKGAPLTVANFVGLARGVHAWRHPKTGEVKREPFYDGLIFHRVIPEFMIQGGDPLGQGSGGPGYEFANEVSKELRHDSGGVLSMANAGPGTNGSQFFVTEQATTQLDGGYNVFGKCAEVDVVKKIARVPVSGSRPVEEVKIKHIEIYRR